MTSDVRTAVFEMPADGKEAGVVGHVIKSGYMIHDRVLRVREKGAGGRERRWARGRERRRGQIRSG